MAPFTPLDGLLIGTATAAVQIEGGDRNNNWYDWSSVPGNIRDGSTPVRSTDHWNRWREDTELMASLGLQTYRMGIEWSRIEPRPGEFDATALARYREEIELLRSHGIVPLVTLHHFTNPSWFQGLGEWTVPASVDIWLRFVRHVVAELRDVVTDWVTINEPNVYAVQTHLFGEGPPGTSSWPAVRKVLRHMAIAHCRAYRLIHDLQPNAQVGFAHHMRVFDPWKPNNPIHQASARVNSLLFQDAVADAFLAGRFHRLLGRPPADIAAGRRYYDYLGINYYTRTASKRMADATFPGSPVNDLGWEIYPEGLLRCARRLHDRYPGPIWVTENGTADNGTADNGDLTTGQLERFRCRFVNDHLTTIATSSLPFERYYHWCFVDNWEWKEGEVPRFGIVHNDYATQIRTVKPSGRFLARIIAEGGISDAAREEFIEPQEYPSSPGEGAAGKPHSAPHDR